MLIHTTDAPAELLRTITGVLHCNQASLPLGTDNAGWQNP